LTVVSLLKLGNVTSYSYIDRC